MSTDLSDDLWPPDTGQRRNQSERASSLTWFCGRPSLCWWPVVPLSGRPRAMRGAGLERLPV